MNKHCGSLYIPDRSSNLEIDKCSSMNAELSQRLGDNDVSTCVDVGRHKNGAKWSRVWPTHTSCGTRPKVAITHSNTFNDRKHALLFVGVRQTDERISSGCSAINTTPSGLLTVQTFQCDCTSVPTCTLVLRAYYYAPGNTIGVAMLCEIAINP